ncbi:methyltransferase domain-containing protein [Pseudonocardia sp. C8]|uniref:class I SAM-dependent methyltransferase n=1 Tax=Pseudonocardia sp. C8 TaxID=2762759 RepID=UPI0016425A65|nr:methyltransferase domain-containing protein [Pseudonocardia sp. C8]MBC3191342.1 methyltransferase domain-containing protein [Pseudonocardia sp. C8]
MGDAARRWRERQSARGLPEHILRAAPADPWTHDPADFAPPVTPADTPSRTAARALAERAAAWGCGGASLLDVGCGGGDAAFAAAWPEPSPVARIVGVDRQADMLAVFAATARERGIPHTTVPGTWPEAAADAGRHDVVVCHHVLHNVVDLPPFLRALTAAARPAGGVVVEMLPEHPMAWLDPLWARFHDLHRPASATADDAVAVLREELGITPEVHRWERAPRLPHGPAWVARRLCLSDDRVPEVEAALAGIPPRRTDAVTLVWSP